MEEARSSEKFERQVVKETSPPCVYEFEWTGNLFDDQARVAATTIFALKSQSIRMGHMFR